MNTDEFAGRLRARIDQLQATLRDTEDRAYAIRGGIAELELLLSQSTRTEPAAPAAEEPE